MLSKYTAHMSLYGSLNEIRQNWDDRTKLEVTTSFKYNAHIGSHVTRYAKDTENIDLNISHFLTAGFAQFCYTLGQLGCFGMNWYVR